MSNLTLLLSFYLHNLSLVTEMPSPSSRPAPSNQKPSESPSRCLLVQVAQSYLCSRLSIAPTQLPLCLTPNPTQDSSQMSRTLTISDTNLVQPHVCALIRPMSAANIWNLHIFLWN